MNNSSQEMVKKILLFHPYLKKFSVQGKLNDYIKKFPNFNEVYASIRKENEKDDTSEVIAKTLLFGIENDLLDEYDLDELLFLILEDSLFNSYLFNLNFNTTNLIDKKSIEELLSSWNIPTQHKILNNINSETTKDFVICGYRIAEDAKGLDSLRILLLDSETRNTYFKNEDSKEIAFPTILEIDFRRKLLHIRLKDVDNLVGESEKVSTMSGRIESTLNFLSSFKPAVQYTEITNFKSSLYLLEEHLLSEKRNVAYKKLEEFDNEIEDFTAKVCNKFNPPTDHEIPPREYINTGVLSVIATTLEKNVLGDVVGIRFRNSQSEERKYAEITIKDTGNKCISTSNLYWLNLSVLQSTKSVEFLKIVPQLESGAAIVNLEFSYETANIRLLQRTTYDGSEGIRPTQEKYDEVIDFIKPFFN
ncbi:hypothetical protein AKG34_13420 [Peribacillus butanolivorans]|uniref:hypothetical protein n=1 Tax=Peribacillus butanolivorans TaxID=421767 RepID=UPI0006A6D5C9|nr:hypothetical protein [Peribacillus butanolivorans]KON69647.1 hypothetical protein AKG34_13420 [Peribacillus butanolivorans]